jgi:hypothetical protein
VLIGLAAVIALAMAGSLARALMRRGSASPSALMTVSPTDALVAEIAALDARREADDPALSAVAYATERASLKARLAAALVAGRSDL